MKVLFVCTANICRSAYAESLARRLAPEGLEYASAGVQGFAEAPMEPSMAEEAVARGADPSAFRSRRLTAQMLAEADLVLTAEARQRRLILEEHPRALRKTFTLGQFARGLAAVADPEPSDGLVDRVRARAATASEDEDVVDPYGRGPVAAHTAAEEIDRLLRVILPALTGAPTAAG